MKLAPRPLIRAAAPAAAAGLVLTAFTLPAVALDPPGSTVTRSGGTVQLVARSGVANVVHVGGQTLADGVHAIVEDESGIAAFNGCRPLDATTADCGVGITQLQIALGDNSDTLFIDQRADQNNPASAPLLYNASVDAGTGPDTIATGRGNDQINLRDGVNGNDRVTCDGGTQDRAIGNPGDSIDPSCEFRVTF
ncbi:hypothetical protein C3489_14985 [Streptomyces sp. Ru71]|uniref:hypothetical protein n=1 Tax=Streptomyces sp. Ru71 TaxID=2080746 RepID=UPI000CDDDC61|nr:hypothetical protein [Streptomyces sp. Ru71]POX53757.1 hypothetical protein C3489_14985 [Streptomyces sp. Ru71]